ncbi:hypothetical protein RvY_02443 [Ramazzottius varieornatus]|uniref:Uncharacterized protein n=1 Tax=Ramazzottius varieornatus TaxID=947166 RepID=A0A1D1UU91_RAMVA|nr:hypothetical protein RvY_02443 [Ramazzottius varieornatus]
MARQCQFILLVSLVVLLDLRTSASVSRQGVKSAAERSLFAFDNGQYPVSDSIATSEEALNNRLGSNEQSAGRTRADAAFQTSFHETLASRISQAVHLRPPAEGDMTVQHDHPVFPGSAHHQLSFRRLRPVSGGYQQEENPASRPTNGEVFDFRPQVPASTATTKSTDFDAEFSRKKTVQLEKELQDARRELSFSKKAFLELWTQLNTTEKERANAQELKVIFENANSALKLENDQIANQLTLEKVKNRQYQIQLREASKHLDLTNATEKLYNVLAVEFPKSNKSLNNSWDPEETIYEGERWLQNWDGREPVLGQHNVTATRVVFLIRHGHYLFSLPEEQITMTSLGMEQMEATGLALSMLKVKWHKTFVHSSKLRTKQAASIIAKHLDPNITLESTPLIWSCADEKDKERRQIAFNTIMHRASPEQKTTSYELIMTHSSIIRYFTERSMQLPMGSIGMPLIHGSVTRIEIPPDGRVLLREYGEFSHLPRNLITASNAKWVGMDSYTTAPNTTDLRTDT